MDLLRGASYRGRLYLLVLLAMLAGLKQMSFKENKNFGRKKGRTFSPTHARREFLRYQPVNHPFYFAGRYKNHYLYYLASLYNPTVLSQRHDTYIQLLILKSTTTFEKIKSFSLCQHYK